MMSKKNDQDPIEKLKEWEDHMYTPGYWINRFDPFFPPKPSVPNLILALIEVILLVPTAVIVVWLYFLEPSVPVIILAVFLIIFACISCLKLWRFSRFLMRNSKKRLEGDEFTTGMKHGKEDEKRYPKRRKDYK